jgi:hypothetical protein
MFTFYALNASGYVLGDCEAQDRGMAAAILGAAYPSLATVQSKASYELGRDQPRRRNNDDEDDGA